MGLGVRCFRRMWVVGYEIFCERCGQGVGEGNTTLHGMDPLLSASSYCVSRSFLGYEHEIVQ